MYTKEGGGVYTKPAFLQEKNDRAAQGENGKNRAKSIKIQWARTCPRKQKRKTVEKERASSSYGERGERKLATASSVDLISKK